MRFGVLEWYVMQGGLVALGYLSRELVASDHDGTGTTGIIQQHGGFPVHTSSLALHETSYQCCLFRCDFSINTHP